MLRPVKWLGVALLAVPGLLLLSNWRLVTMAVHQPQLFSPADFDHTPPDVSRIGDQRHLLVFSKTNGYRHHDAIPAAQHMLEQIAANNGWFVYATENAAAFNDKTLGEFDVVVLNNSSGSLYTPAQQLALRQFLEAGGGLVALRAAGPDIELLINIDEVRNSSEWSLMGVRHPLVWSCRIGSGKVVYSAMGDTVETYREPSYLKLVTQAIEWATRQKT